MHFIGYDVGSSSIKASLIDAEEGRSVASAQFPEKEMKISAPQKGWAEQSPEEWWGNVKIVTKKLLVDSNIPKEEIKAIGISYQMHGLALVNKSQNVLRNSIIWCDSRAVEIGNDAFQKIGKQKCLNSLLNSPGNFTASKLGWVKENEPEIFEDAYKFMLPGDFIAMKLTGEIRTTISGLSEGIFWDFEKNEVAEFLLEHYGFTKDLIPELVPNLGIQGYVSENAAGETGLSAGTPITYRAGDQPNNALSLNVLEPGEVAATAGTSGVVYGVTEKIKYDPLSRVNTFVHVNHSQENKRLGVLLCINGTAISNAWIKRIAGSDISYDEMNHKILEVEPGSDGVMFIPFGNGAERMLENKDAGASFIDLNFNMHSQAHLFRAVQEGVAYSFKYGMDIMNESGITPEVVRAGNANMFQSPVFRQTLANILGVEIELYDTDGSIGAARGAGLGLGYYKNSEEAFMNLNIIDVIKPQKSEIYLNQYSKWLDKLDLIIKT